MKCRKCEQEMVRTESTYKITYSCPACGQHDFVLTTGCLTIDKFLQEGISFKKLPQFQGKTYI